MAIPWLIGAAVVAIAAAVVNDSAEEKRKKEEEAERRRASEKARLEEEARAERRRAREEARLEEERQQKDSAKRKAKQLLIDYDIPFTLGFLDEIAELAINNQSKCEQSLQMSYTDSSTHKSMQEQIIVTERALKEIDKLSTILKQQ